MTRDEPRAASSSRSDRDLIAGARSQAARAAPAGLPTDSFPGYEITHELHRGGQGVVYQAIQKSTTRKVAIKVIRQGPFASLHDKARFDREVHVLAQLQHPSIVAIHDSGEAAGLFYFVMDYIPGQPLDAYMETHGREIDESLRLFGRICEAVNAAHLRGVIHRDLKPSNIRIDADSEPHILDFGLAKIESDQSPGASVSAMTMTGQFVGSLPWASPEQAEGAPGKIDVRTDVYSLGVILYQMLTGRFPYEVVGSMRRVLDNIMTVTPARPGSIRRQIDDEVETIILKCLSKEPERRYQTAGELARDIGRYLGGEPILAKGDSPLANWYVLRKTLHRYRFQVRVASFALILIIALAGTMSVLYIHAIGGWNAAQDQAAIEARGRQLAETARLTAEQQADSAVAVQQFLESWLLPADGPAPMQRDPATLRSMLDGAARRIETDASAADPLARAAVHRALALAYRHLSDLDAAETHFRAAESLLQERLTDLVASRGSGDPRTRAAREQLAELYTSWGKPDAASELPTPAP